MAKKRQLNVRLPDALLSQLEERVQRTKMGMAAMVEVLLVQALQQQEISEPKSLQSDRLARLEQRIEALETKLATGSHDSQQVEVASSVEVLSLAPSTSIETNTDQSEEIASSITLEVRPAKQKKEKTNSKVPNPKIPSFKVPN